MTKEDYIHMKQAGQFSLPCFYQYYADHVHEARDSTLRDFEEFSTAFPVWWEQPIQQLSRNGIIQKVQGHFDTKFGITKIDSLAASNPGTFGGVGDQQHSRPPDPFGFYNQQNTHGL